GVPGSWIASSAMPPRNDASELALESWSASARRRRRRFVGHVAGRKHIACRLEPRRLQLAGSFEHRVRDRADMRVDAFQVAQDVEMKRARLDALGAALAQAREMIVGGDALGLAHRHLLLDEPARDLGVARDEDAERELEVIGDAAMEGLELGRALAREFELAPDLLRRQLHQVHLDDVADMLEIDGEGDDLHGAAAVGA